jgi:hypothetical protein
VRHHHLQRTDKARLQLRSMHASGVRLSGLAGLYAHFMTIAHGWMSPDAIAGWLIPSEFMDASEFMDVNYGRALKHYLLDAVTLLRIHRFDPAQRQFSDARVSSAIVWLQNRRPVPGHQVEFSYGGSLSNPAIDRRAGSRARYPTSVPAADSSGGAATGIQRGDGQRGRGTADRAWAMAARLPLAGGSDSRALSAAVAIPRRRP